MKLSQTKIIYSLLSIGQPVSTYQIAKAIGGQCLVRISERIREIKKQYNVEIKSFRDSENKSLWWYQIEPNGIGILEGITFPLSHSDQAIEKFLN